MKDKQGRHSTNYFDTFIQVADDTRSINGTIPPSKRDGKSIAEMQYEMLAAHPYRYTSDEVLFHVYAVRNDLTRDEYKAARSEFFSKGQACFRASPLTKSYGFGVHFNREGKMAIYGMETAEYERMAADKKLNHVKAMRASRK